MPTLDGWVKERKGHYFGVEEMPDGEFAVGVIRSVRNPFRKETTWQAAATVKTDLTETVKWIDACFTHFNDDPWNVDIVEFFESFKEARDVYTLVLLELAAGEMLPNGEMVEAK